MKLTVGKLRALLAEYDEAMPIVTSGYESGYEDAGVWQTRVILNAEPDVHYEGTHQEVNDLDYRHSEAEARELGLEIKSVLVI